ncbi:MAG TPA: DNA polymerase IV [Muricauda sp.]|uniref:DNA polymerase IV n=1 Tax=Flagellimonas aurea TaxID=2915619 RepID=A0ABS3G614_9FLAO|nr:DNA polymerase IV [Allomuricauda aurea]MAO18486.1 DNA polymerase IV [Allomuricauda sp.]MBC72340.1 DNA polymerase IV [Allomuricauda sp.]MBO0354854.1 DNA polymerase IV [Allomuricauda aurea]HBU77550.1 DNA polymerase IV [Allomuricauda sp.]|tara:strand:- start:4541 stop:5755 length:1215 start_codon:yes stop_codon:yes gene_type:complete
MEKTILHLDLDTFYVSVERIINTELKNKPLLVGGTSDRGVVAACSYETRGFGVHSGMPMKMAKELCPEAVVIRGNAGTYSKYSDVVTEIIKEHVPVFEKSSIDEFYADLSGMDRFFGCYKYATEMRQKIIRETGLPISFGLSVNKVVSKVATNEAKPNNQLKIDFGLEKPFLAPLSIKKIPMVGDKTYQTLRNLGIRQVKTIQDMPMDIMQRVLGANGQVIWKRANGIDNTPVIPFHDRKSISNERTFDRDTIDVVKLRGILIAMTENLAYQLRRGDKLTACIAVKIRYSDFNTYSKQSQIPYTSADHTLIPKILELFDSLYNKRMLVRLIGIRFSHLVSGNYQINLFEDTKETLSLYQAMDRVRNRFGSRSVLRASAMGAKTIESMHNPFNGEPPVVLAHRKQ